MSTKALIGILLAGTIGILIFLFVHLSGDSPKVSIGSKEATACSKGGDECLPDVNYIDTTGHAHRCTNLSGRRPAVTLHLYGGLLEDYRNFDLVEGGRYVALPAVARIEGSIGPARVRGA